MPHKESLTRRSIYTIFEDFPDIDKSEKDGK